MSVAQISAMASDQSSLMCELPAGRPLTRGSFARLVAPDNTIRMKLKAVKKAETERKGGKKGRSRSRKKK